jgi:SRSO17 transposase
VQVAGARRPIEECFGASKNETGLDNYQIRTWNAWHRHIAFSMLAHTFLAITAHPARKSGDHTPPASQTSEPGSRADTPPPDPAHTR